MGVRAETKPLRAPLSGGREGATVVVEPILTGTMSCPRAFIESASTLATLRMLGIGTPRSRYLKLPIPAYLVRHPSGGPFLVDTGLHASVGTKPVANLGRTLARFSRPKIEPGADLPSQLRARASIRRR